MYVKVEPSGCCERKGLVQIRFCMYLDKGDYGYNVHHIQVPVIPEEGYQGEVGEEGRPKDEEDYRKWIDSLPKIWQTNPFHNHFIYVEPETTDEEIMDIGEAFLQEAYIKWACGEKLDLKNPPVKYPEFVNEERRQAVETKVIHLRETILERRQ